MEGCTNHHPLPCNSHHHHDNYLSQGNTKDGDEAWPVLPVRCSEINLLANSLTARLRRATAGNAATSSSKMMTIATTSPSTSPKSVGPCHPKKKHGSSFCKTHIGDDASPSSIPKWILQKGKEKRRRRYSLDQTFQYISSPEGFPAVLPDRQHQHQQVVNLSHQNEACAELDRIKHPNLHPASAEVEESSIRNSLNSNGQVVWVKRAGIFQLANKYAQRRQTLHRVQPSSIRSLAIDYRIVKLPVTSDINPRTDIPEYRKNIMKTSSSHTEGGSNPSDTAVTTQKATSSAILESNRDSCNHLSKRLFIPGSSPVHCIGVKWKIPILNTEKSAYCKSHPGDDQLSALPSSALRECPSCVHHCRQTASPLSKRSTSTRDPRHPWRSLHSRDVHPVTTAMDREGTTVSRTKWHVPRLHRRMSARALFRPSRACAQFTIDDTRLW